MTDLPLALLLAAIALGVTGLVTLPIIFVIVALGVILAGIIAEGYQ